MRITDPSQLHPGKIIYRVHAYTEQRKIKWCSIERYEVIRVPITSTPGNMSNFIELRPAQFYIKVNFDNYTWDYNSFGFSTFQEHSMQDMGVIANTYNSHQTFDNEEDAKKYICQIINLNIVEPEKKRNRNSYDRAMKVLDLD